MLGGLSHAAGSRSALTHRPVWLIGRTSASALKHLRHAQDLCVHFAFVSQHLHPCAGDFEEGLWQPPASLRCECMVC